MRLAAVLTRLLAAVAGTTVGFTLLNGPVRVAETSATVWLLHFLGAQRVAAVGGTSIQIFPPGGLPLRAVITASCSSCSSLVALTCLALLVPPRAGSNRGAAAATALAVVAVGNVVRITASVLLGYVAGRASLVLFHDWVGSAFTFAYTLGGFILMLVLLLPPQGAGVPLGAAAEAGR